MEARVHQELLCFLTKHSLDKIIRNIDEIVLSYLVSVVDLISSSADDDVLDVVELMEMMNAYLPGFDQIGRSEIIDWMFGLTSKLMVSSQETPNKKEAVSSLELKTEAITNTDRRQDLIVEEKRFPVYDYSEKSSSCQTTDTICASNSDCVKRSMNFDLYTDTRKDIKKDQGRNCDPVVPSLISRCTDTHTFTKLTSVPKNLSLQSDSAQDGKRVDSSSQHHQNNSSKADNLACEENQVRILLEMFPATCSVEAYHCFRLSAGDMDLAAQLIMDRQEGGQSISGETDSSFMARTAGQNPLQRLDMKVNKQDIPRLDDGCIKSCVLEKYSFIDTEEDKRTYRPLPPKKEAKKLVRYRDGQVVSTKGERFSQVEKKEDSDMKHTYVNLKPARKYRFH